MVGQGAESGLRLPAQLCPPGDGREEMLSSLPHEAGSHLPICSSRRDEDHHEPCGLQPAVNRESLLVPGTYTQEQAFPFQTAN